MKKLFFIAMALLPAAAWAHDGDHSLLNASAGLLHPLSGLDHLLALLATGFWLSQTDARPKSVFIVGFAVTLALTIPFGMQFTHLTFEAGIVATLVVLGALMAAAIRGPLAVRAMVVLATAAVHGFVHGAELPAGEGVAFFSAGLILSSLVVMASAAMAGTYVSRATQGLATRLMGVAVIIAGLLLSF